MGKSVDKSHFMVINGESIGVQKPVVCPISEPRLNPQSSSHSLPEILHPLRKSKSVPPCRWLLPPASVISSRPPDTLQLPEVHQLPAAILQPPPPPTPLDDVRVQGQSVTSLPGEVTLPGGKRSSRHVSFSTHTILEEDEEGAMEESSPRIPELYRLHKEAATQPQQMPILYRLRHWKASRRHATRVKPGESQDSDKHTPRDPTHAPREPQASSDIVRTALELRRATAVREQMAFERQSENSHTYVQVINYKSPRVSKPPVHESPRVPCGSSSSSSLPPAPIRLFQSRADERSRAVTQFLDQLATEGRIPLVRESRDNGVAEGAEAGAGAGDRKESRQHRVPAATALRAPALMHKSHGGKADEMAVHGGQRLPGKKIWVIKKKREKSLPLPPSNTPITHNHNVLHVYLPRPGTQGTS